jgi:hypothetical protein
LGLLASAVTLHVLTAVTRPHNLSKMAESLNAWGRADFTWHMRFDAKHEHVGGQAVKNEMLHSIEDGWVMFLDDDTLAHPKLYRRFLKHQEAEAICVTQRHSVLGTLHASRENVGVGTIDIGQALIRRDVIGDMRIPETYAGDGEFLSAILPYADTVYLDEVLSFHNAIGE